MSRICDTCIMWRDYLDDMDQHPDYDGHCVFRGIMTLNEQECPEYDGEHQPAIEISPELWAKIKAWRQ